MIISVLSYRFCVFVLSYLFSFLVFSIFLHPGPFSLLQPHLYPYLWAKTGRKLCGENQRRMNYRDMSEGWQPLLLIMNVLQQHHIPLPLCGPTTPRFSMTMKILQPVEFEQRRYASSKWKYYFLSHQLECRVMTGVGTAILDQR